MKHLIKLWLFYVFALWLVNQLFPAFIVHGGWQGIFLSGIILSILMLIVKPILKILFIPINVITFGLLSWIVNVIVVYLLTIFSPAVTIVSWTFPGIIWQGFVIPSAFVPYWLCVTIATFGITCITNILEDVTN